jgi:hypothetical protein
MEVVGPPNGVSTVNQTERAFSSPSRSPTYRLSNGLGQGLIVCRCQRLAESNDWPCVSPETWQRDLHLRRLTETRMKEPTKPPNTSSRPRDIRVLVKRQAFLSPKVMQVL